MEDYQRELEAAAACEPGDTCVIGGGIQCACASPINQDAVDDLMTLSEDVDCEGLIVACLVLSNPRCENNTCIADLQ